MANLLLQDPFSVLKEYPEKLTHTFESPLHAVCVQFSPRGDYLAMGCSNGAVVVYDMDTSKPICMLGNKGGGHVRAIQSIAWSYCGRYVLTTSRDWYIKLWDLAQGGHIYRQYRFDSPVWNAKFVPNTKFQCVATVFEEKRAFLLDFESDIPSLRVLIAKTEMGSEDADGVDPGYTLVSCCHQKFTDILITGTSKGWINMYRASQQNFELIYSTKIANSNVKHIIISQSGDKLAINSSDRTIRQYTLSIAEDYTNIQLDLEHKYQDVINKLQWNSIFFSSNSAEYLVASTHGSSAHDIYLWETSTGTLVRVLEGTEEELLDIDWNFYSMCIASNGLETGNVYVWSILIPPKWSALAPDFEEVEENIEYQEKEDEFDQVDQLEQQQELNEAEEVEIDLCTEERYDVRGNDLTMPRFVIPINYEDILMLKELKE